MLSVRYSRKITDWGGHRCIIGLVGLEELLDVLDCIISGV